MYQTIAHPPSKTRRCRHGVTVVECAVVLSVLLLFILGIVEFGRVMMVQHILTNGAREGARRAVVANPNQAEVEAAVADYMKTCGLSSCQMAMTDLSTVGAGDPITVTVTIPYKQVTWLPVKSLGGLENKNLSVTVRMIKEADFDY
jgi:Flp pilus assembly protein TadG